MASQQYELYYNKYSVCSAMVRYIYANAVETADNCRPISLDPKEVNIFTNEQITEFYLCEVNPKGQVPVIVSTGTPKERIPDSLDITFWLCERYPSLRPREYAGEIDRLLRELHAINFFSLTFRNKAARAKAMEGGIIDRINEPGISARYKKALEYKLEVTRSEKIAGLERALVDAEVERARSYLDEIESIRKQHRGSEWIFGTPAQTALDASVMVFLLRLLDVDLKEVIPSGLYDLAAKAKETDAMKESYVSM